MQSCVMIDGQLVPPERALVSVFDRGFLYGDSVFESLRSYHGQLVTLDRHLARLERSAERVLIPLPVPLVTLREEVVRAVGAGGHAESYVRLMITRGTADALGLDPELARDPLRVLIVTRLQPPASAIYERGISAITYRAERPTDAPAVADAKIGNYLLAVLAMRRARQAGASEALLEDASGAILEGTTSNVFAVVRGVLITAPESAAILPGITRESMIALAREAGIACEQRVISRVELQRAEEIFITSSIREVVPVVELDGQPVGSRVPGPVARELLQRYRSSMGA